LAQAAGILDKLSALGEGEEVTEDVVVEMDAMSKRLLRRQRGRGEKEVAGEKESGASREQLLFELREKLAVVGAAKDGTSLGTYSLLNEVKDKGLVAADPQLVQVGRVRGLSRRGAAKVCLATLISLPPHFLARTR